MMSRVGAWIAAIGVHAGVLLAGGAGGERLHADTSLEQVGPCEFLELAEHVSPASLASADARLPSDHPIVNPVRHRARVRRAHSAPAAPAPEVPSPPSKPEVLDLTAVSGAPRFAVTAASSRAHGSEVGGSGSEPSGRGAGGSGGGAAMGPERGAGGASSASRGIRVSSRRWRCPWPASAERLAIHRERVEVRVCVDEGGKLRDVELRHDPGYGFGGAALACASKARFSPAVDDDGRPRAACAPLVVRFER